MPDLSLLAGPAALAIAATVATIALWRQHVKDDQMRDDAVRSLTDSVGQFPGALRDLTSVVLDASERERSRARNERMGDR